MNAALAQRSILLQPMCRRCALQIFRSTSLLTNTTSQTPWPQQEKRVYHNIRLETVREAWQQLKKEFKYLKKANTNQTPSPQDYGLGLEIGTATFLIRAGATVHFSNGRWYGKKLDKNKTSWPGNEAVGHAVNAVDAKGTLLDHNGFRDLVNLKQVKFLNLEGCPYVDDACLASLVHFRSTLSHLNINKCQGVTASGIATLHKLRKLQHLNMSDLPNVKYSKLIASMLEDILPDLRVNIISHLVEKEDGRSERARENI